MSLLCANLRSVLLDTHRERTFAVLLDSPTVSLTIQVSVLHRLVWVNDFYRTIRHITQASYYTRGGVVSSNMPSGGQDARLKWTKKAESVSMAAGFSLRLLHTASSCWSPIMIRTSLCNMPLHTLCSMAFESHSFVLCRLYCTFLSALSPPDLLSEQYRRLTLKAVVRNCSVAAVVGAYVVRGCFGGFLAYHSSNELESAKYR